MASYSVIIKGGLILQDKKLERLDIAINGEKIEALGDFSAHEAGLVVDASGKYVSSGFIDLTSHSDTHWTIFSQPKQESLLTQGITTILGGNCGSSLAPLLKASDIEGIQKWANVREINTNWYSVGEFFQELEKHPIGVNFATLVGHGTLRRGLLGEDAREMNEKELDELYFLIKGAMKEGAFGVSTSLASAHAKYASTQELKLIFKAVAEQGGLTKHHLKDEGRQILPAIAEMMSLGKEYKAKLELSHFKIIGRGSWNMLPDAINFIESARQVGAEVTIDLFPYTKTGSLLYMLLPPWIVEGGKEKILASLRDPNLRGEVLEYLRSLTLHYDKMVVASTLNDPTSVGKTIQEISASSGMPGEEVIAELIEVNELRTSLFNEVISPEHLEELIKKDYAMIASDGVGYNLRPNMPFDLPHPRSFGAFPLALELFARKKKILSWEEILYKFTQLPAQTLDLKDRGSVKPGFYADLVLIDPEKVGSTTDYSAIHHEVLGIDWVFVNGKTAVKNGIPTAEFAGKVIKKQ